MSSPASQDGSETKEAQESPGQAQTAVTETTECVNCGRTFVGDYCPSCGQEADTTISPLDVVAGFFRELVDLERGFWPTFKGLVVRPRTTLHDYVSGSRQRFSHPGRYLMAAIVLAYLSERTLVWVGIRGAYEPPEIGAELGSNPGLEELVGAFVPEKTLFGPAQILLSSQEFLIFASLLLALLVGLMLYQLLRDRLGGGEALAVGAFIAAQMILFGTLYACIFDTYMYLTCCSIRIPFSIHFLVGSFLYAAFLAFQNSDEKSIDLLSLALEEEPNYFFGSKLMYSLNYVVWQHFIISSLLGVMIKYYIIGVLIPTTIIFFLIPNVAIEVYYQLT